MNAILLGSCLLVVFVAGTLSAPVRETPEPPKTPRTGEEPIRRTPEPSQTPRDGQEPTRGTPEPPQQHRSRDDDDDEGRRRVRSHLKKIGWCNSNQTNDTAVTRRCLRRYQRFYNLTETGEPDNETMTLMKTPRCGVPDRNSTSDRRKRYVLYPIKWSIRTLTYCILNYTNDLSSSLIQQIAKLAFNQWSAVANINFTDSVQSCLRANLRISWERLDHGDGYPFDGSGGQLAHAFFPTNGRIHFDDDETWTDGSRLGTNFFQVATHEFGHAIGLEHSPDQSAVMYAYYTGYKPNFALGTDDILGIQALYGARTPVSTTTTTPRSSSTTTTTRSTSTSTTRSTSTTTTTRPTSTTTTTRSTSTSRSTSKSTPTSQPTAPAARTTPTSTITTTTPRTTTTTRRTSTTTKWIPVPITPSRCSGWRWFWGYC